MSREYKGLHCSWNVRIIVYYPNYPDTSVDTTGKGSFAVIIWTLNSEGNKLGAVLLKGLKSIQSST